MAGVIKNGNIDRLHYTTYHDRNKKVYFNTPEKKHCLIIWSPLYLFMQTMNFVNTFCDERAITNSTICGQYYIIFSNVIIVLFSLFFYLFIFDCVICLLNPFCFTEVYWHVNCIYIAYYIAYNFVQFTTISLLFSFFFYAFVYQIYFSINTRGSEIESVHVNTFYTLSVCFVWLV